MICGVQFLWKNGDLLEIALSKRVIRHQHILFIFTAENGYPR